MGWQARLNKNKETESIKSCNKCNNTGVRGHYIAMDGQIQEEPVPIKCIHVLKQEAEDFRRAQQAATDKKLVEGLLKDEAASGVIVIPK